MTEPVKHSSDGRPHGPLPRSPRQVCSDLTFCCLCHWGARNQAFFELSTATWGYEVDADVMRVLWRPPSQQGRPSATSLKVTTIDHFSQRSEENLNHIVNRVADAVAGRLNEVP